MLCSVVILNWNRPEDTIKAVNSVTQSQPAGDYEIVIWDNASSDNSVELISEAFESNQNIRIIAAEANYGVAGGRNRAFDACSGEIVVFLDNDIIVETSGCLSIIQQVFEKHPEVGAISFEIVRPDGHLMWPFSRPSSTWRQHSFETIRFDGGASAIRREAFLRAGKFAEYFSPYGAEDAHFSFKLLQYGYTIRYEPSIRMIHAFSTAGRSPLQFSFHVRNSLWIPMEKFPWPYAVISVLRKILEFSSDAYQHSLFRPLLRGLWMTLFHFSLKRRDPLSTESWRSLRKLIKIDKDLAVAHSNQKTASSRT